MGVEPDDPESLRAGSCNRAERASAVTGEHQWKESVCTGIAHAPAQRAVQLEAGRDLSPERQSGFNE
jgi:hypothetical protein